MKNIQKYQHRYQVISLLDNGFCTVKKAVHELKLSERHIRKLLSKFRDNGKTITCLMSQPRPPVWNGTTQNIIDEIIRLKKENLIRSNQHIAEMVEEKFDKKISHSTIRRILIKYGCYQKTKTERRTFQKLEN